MRSGTTLTFDGCRIACWAAEGLSDRLGDLASIRPMGADQSNSSVVIDEAVALKLYRRIEPGVSPELEILRFLTERGFEHVAALEGYVAYEGRPLETTLALLQRFVPSRGDGWQLALDTIASDPNWLPGAGGAARRGDRAPAQHAGLRSCRPALRARGAELGVAVAPLGLRRRGDRARVLDPPGDRAARADRRARRGGARPAAPAHAHRQRREDRAHARRLPPRPGAAHGRRRLADPRLRGRAGAQRSRAPAQALAAPRRRRDAALVRVRSVGLEAAARGRAAGGLGGELPHELPRRLHHAPRIRRSCRPGSRRSSGC